MKGRAIIAIACAAMLAGTVTTRSQTRVITPKEVAARRAELQKVLDAYIAGDHDAVVRELRNPNPQDSLTRAALDQLFSIREAKWHPARAAFAIEVAVALRTTAPFNVHWALRYSRTVLALRPTAIGKNTAEDQFELLCHQIALGILEGVGLWFAHHEYLIQVSPRLVALEAALPAVPNRLALMRALDATMTCCSNLIERGLAPVFVVINPGAARSPTPPPPNPALAIAMYENAAGDPRLRQEALVRGAFLHERQGHVPAGLALIDRAGVSGDIVIDFAAAMIRAGLFDRGGRPDEAAEAYEAAMRVAPGAQVPAIGRAAALQRAGRIEEAVAAADHAKRMVTDAVDSWLVFLKADDRFVDKWLAELRGMLQ